MDKQLEYFKIFCKISKAFGSALSNAELLDLIVASAIETMEAKAACLFLADERQDLFVPMAQKGLSEHYLHAGPLNAKKVVSAIIDGGYLHFYDATTDPRLQHHELKKAEGIATILTVPVRVRDKTIGILSLYTSEKRNFKTHEIEFLTALAEQGAVALENARLFERLRKNALLFRDLASSINSSLDIKKIMHTLTAEVCETLGMKGVTVRLINETADTLDLVASYGLSQKFLDKGPVSAEKSITEALEGRTVVIENVAADSRIQYRQAFIDEGIVSMLCVPIKSRDAVMGVMRLYSDTSRTYPPDLVATVEALAQTGGLAIQNASMYLRLEQEHDSLEKEIWRHRAYF